MHETDSRPRQTVKACPSCFRTFAEEVRFCGICGETLIERTITEPLATVQQTSESSYLGATIDGRYQIKRLVGRGGMGTVYEVEHVHMQKTLAMKLLHEDMVVRKQLVSRFTREARAISRLSGEHTVRVYDFGRHKAVFFLVMEFLDGEDLEVILSREGALPWRRALRILDQICESLGEAHRAGIIHRDLKPENIMILRQPRGADFVKVLDFGLAKINNAEDVFSVHSHRDLFGTPFYMSPEQIRAEELDHRADIYSLGCLAFRLLTNQHVYDAPYAFDVLRQHLTSPIPSAGRVRPDLDIPARVDRMVWRALAKRPENRYPNAAAMRQEIAGCLADPSGESLPLPSSVPEPDQIPELDDELKARLRAFEHSHRAAEARLHGDEPPDLPVGIPVVDITVEPDDEDEPRPPPPVMREPAISGPGVARTATTPAPTWPPEEGTSPSYDEAYDELGLDEPLSVEGERLRRHRRLKLVAAALGFVAVLAAGVMLVVQHDPPVPRDEEQEPNNHISRAQRLKPGQPVTGLVGKRLSTFEADRDMYRLAAPGAARFLELELSGIGNLDLYVDVLDPGGRQLARIDRDGIGQPEMLHRFRVPSPEVILVVSESKAGDAQPTENADDRYTLVARLDDQLDGPGDVEPNDTPAAANAYQPGEQITGWLDGPGDVDFYEIQPDSEKDLRRWEIAIETRSPLVPRVTLYRRVAGAGVPVFADEGRESLLRTVYEEPHRAASTYLLAVEHSGRGARHGRYKLVADLQPARARIAHEPNDDRARATSVAIGQEIHGMIESEGDVDVFAIPVTDPRHRAVEVVIDSATREKVVLTLSDINKAHLREFPRLSAVDENAPPQPREGSRGPIRFQGEGETYYLSVRPRGRVKDIGYTLRVLRLTDHRPGAPVGGPAY